MEIIKIEEDVEVVLFYLKSPITGRFFVAKTEKNGFNAPFFKGVFEITEKVQKEWPLSRAWDYPSVLEEPFWDWEFGQGQFLNEYTPKKVAGRTVEAVRNALGAISI